MEIQHFVVTFVTDKTAANNGDALAKLLDGASLEAWLLTGSYSSVLDVAQHLPGDIEAAVRRASDSRADLDDD